MSQLIIYLMEPLLSAIVRAMSHDLDARGVSTYARAKSSGLRPDVVKRIERGEGKLSNAASYIEGYSKAYPDVAYRLLINAASMLCNRYK